MTQTNMSLLSLVFIRRSSTLPMVSCPSKPSLMRLRLLLLPVSISMRNTSAGSLMLTLVAISASPVQVPVAPPPESHRLPQKEARLPDLQGHLQQTVQLTVTHANEFVLGELLRQVLLKGINHPSLSKGRGPLRQRTTAHEVLRQKAVQLTKALKTTGNAGI